jgi:hypothetical protein
MHGAHTAYIRLFVWSLTVANARSTHKSALPTQSLLQKQHKTDRNPAIQTTAHTKKRLTLSIAHSTMKLLRFHNAWSHTSASALARFAIPISKDRKTDNAPRNKDTHKHSRSHTRLLAQQHTMCSAQIDNAHRFSKSTSARLL